MRPTTGTIHTAYVGLGSNVGDRMEHLRAAVEDIERCVGRNVRYSSAYETDPIGLECQPQFLNAVCGVDTDLQPRDLLSALLVIEDSHGRRRTTRYGPRTLDLDILLYGDLITDEPELTVPHPRMAERRFVLVPLAEIAPKAVHPGSGRTIEEILAGLMDLQRVGPPLNLKV